MTEHPKLFISYSHDDEKHKSWVLKLATDLRQRMGVDVILDQWDLRIGSDLALYMEQGLNNSAMVLCICSDKYVEKANQGRGGTGYEKMIMTRSLIKTSYIDYIIPIIRNNTLEEKLPTFLGTKLYIDFSNDKEYLNNISKLTSRIYNEDLTKKPPIGQSPFENTDFIDTKNAFEKVQYHSPQMSGTVTFDYSNNNHCYTIGSGEYEFVTKWSACGTNCIYAYSDRVKNIGYLPNYQTFPTTYQLKDFDYTSRCRTVYVNEVIIWVNKFGKVAATKILSVTRRSQFSGKDLLSFEYIIYN